MARRRTARGQGSARAPGSPRKIGDLVAGLLRRSQAGGRLGLQALRARWEGVVGGLSGISRPRRLARGVLEVDVASAAGIQELTLRAEGILHALSEQEGPVVRELRFRLGVF